MHLENVRRSGRIPKEIPVLLIGSDSRGRVFAERTATVMISRHGAGVVSHHDLAPEQEMVIRLVETNCEAEIRVIGRIASHSTGDTYALTFLDTDRNFWGVEFPIPADSELEARSFVLKCSGCNSRKTIRHSEIESDVYDLNASIARYCNDCGLSTVWKLASDEADHKVVPPKPKQKPALSLSSMLAVGSGNRRKRIRAKVSFAGCVRCDRFDDDSVVCEDISLGGLRFTSCKSYSEKSVIEIAAPYAPGMPGIFVRAEIIYVLALPEVKRFRCGAAYIKSS